MKPDKDKVKKIATVLLFLITFLFGYEVYRTWRTKRTVKNVVELLMQGPFKTIKAIPDSKAIVPFLNKEGDSSEEKEVTNDLTEILKNQKEIIQILNQIKGQLEHKRFRFR